MKTIYFFSCIFLLALALPAAVQAKVTQEQLAEADEYYHQGEFKKAYRIYYKMETPQLCWGGTQSLTVSGIS